MALTTEAREAATRAWIEKAFVTQNVTAHCSLSDVLAAITAVDNALDATLSAAALAYGGTTTVVQAFLACLPEPFKSRATAGQKALILSFVAMKRGGVI